MAKRTRMPTDRNERARAIVDLATSDESVADLKAAKDPAAVARGRAGGRKGGKARAEKLTAEQRAEIARRAASARWAGTSDE